jgi:uncharacterized protein
MASTEMLLDAIRRRDNAAVRTLLDEEPELVLSRGRNGDSPVMMAIYLSAGSILAMLVARGAEVDVFAAAALGSVERLDAALQGDAEQLHAYSHDGWTPLHLAAFFGHRGAVEVLLDRGADIRVRSRNEMTNTPLHAALAGQGVAAVVEVLLARGAEVNARAATGVTPLHLAASRGTLELAEALLDRGATAEARLDDGSTPAEMAAARGHDLVAEVLRRRMSTPAPA